MLWMQLHVKHDTSIPYQGVSEVCVLSLPQRGCELVVTAGESAARIRQVVVLLYQRVDVKRCVDEGWKLDT